MDTNSVTTMYDTIHFILFKEDYPEIDFINSIPSLLTQIVNQGDSNYGPFVNGFLNNYQVNINQWRMKFQHASIGKYINGDNLQGMSLRRTREAFEKLSLQLHLNLDKAKVTRLDLGRNLLMQLSPSSYLSYLGEHIHYKRFLYESGLLYKNSGRELVFYDKVKEQKHKRLEIPELFIGRNVLRFELRYKNHLEREFKVDKLRISNITEETFYVEILKRWKQEYLNIKKLSNKASELEPTISTRELIVNLAAMAIRDIGSDYLTKKIGEWQEKGIIGKKQASDHRKAIRDAILKEFKANGNELIDELDKKVKEAIRFYI